MPLLRLAALIAGAILLAVVLVLWARSCREEQRRAEYESYMENVATVVGDSEKIGAGLNQLIATPGLRVDDLRTELAGLRQQQSQNVAAAQALDPPGPLREQQEDLVKALQLRVNGLNGLSSAFEQVDDTNEAGLQAAGRVLAQQYYRLVASDVVYEDLFRAPAAEVLEREGIQGVAVPESRFVENTELASPGSWNLVVKRLVQGPTATGLHGNQLIGVRVLPGGKTLSPDEDNTVPASDRLAFHVLVQNSGDNQEAQVTVRLTIQQNPLIRKEQVIDIIDPGETKTVVFRNLGPPSLGTRVTVKVSVEPVTGETNTNNNSADYPVIFTLP